MPNQVILREVDCRDEKREVIERELRKTFHEVAHPHPSAL